MTSKEQAMAELRLLLAVGGSRAEIAALEAEVPAFREPLTEAEKDKVFHRLFAAATVGAITLGPDAGAGMKLAFYACGFDDEEIAERGRVWAEQADA